MASFYNQATLSYTGGTVSSNITVGEVAEVVKALTTPVSASYSVGSVVTYLISLTNTGTVPVTDVTVDVDLGAYEYGGTTVYPLSYVTGSVQQLVDGATAAAPTVTVNDGVTFSGITIPADGNVLIAFETKATAYAPMGDGAEITNIATINGSCIVEAVVASATVPANDAPVLEIIKSLEPEVLTGCGEVTYTFEIRNMGGAAAADAQIVLTDNFDPILTDIAVTLNDAAFTAYTYSETTGAFVTDAGTITVPAATYTQNTDGTWSTVPGTTTVVIAGTM